MLEFEKRCLIFKYCPHCSFFYNILMLIKTQHNDKNNYTFLCENFLEKLYYQITIKKEDFAIYIFEK